MWHNSTLIFGVPNTAFDAFWTKVQFDLMLHLSGGFAFSLQAHILRSNSAISAKYLYINRDLKNRISSSGQLVIVS